MTPSIALALAHGRMKGVLSAESTTKITRSWRSVQNIVASQETVYGVNTGFGSLCNRQISSEDTQVLQHNILKSHSVGVGKPVPLQIAKLMMILKVHSLALGYSGVALQTLERICWHIDQDLIPVVPQQGSVGASGDLAPLAHLFLPLIGLGEISLGDQHVPALQVLQKRNKQPINLGAKEGLALINGTQFMAAYAILIISRFHNCLAHADIIGAMSLEAVMGSIRPFDLRLHKLRPFHGVQHVAHRVRVLLSESEVMESHIDCGRVQDPYSLRCIPQVHGSSRQAWLHLKETITIELNSVTDNPLIFDENLSISGGNFHGQPLALPLDYNAIAAAELGNISDRRIYLLLEGKTEGLPQLLMHNTGLNSGFMVPQYTSAALVSENKSLSFPASVDSIPTSLGQEDHVSMGSISGRKTLAIIENLEQILAIELLCAAQAFDFRRPLKSGKILEECHQHIRSWIDHAMTDRIFAEDIEIAHDIICQRSLLKITESYADLKSEFHELFEIY